MRKSANLRHGYTGTKTYAAWCRMRRRCTNQNSESFRHYGGRGIQVCDRWMSFELFLEDMGEAPAGYSLDRIDTNGGYEPTNCRWASPKTQANNRRSNRVVEFAGTTRTLSEWAEYLGIRLGTLHKRICVLGWPAEKALTENVGARNKTKSARSTKE